MKIVGFTGTRQGLPEPQRAALNEVLALQCGAFGQLHHGDAIGADAQAHVVARNNGIRVVIHPPDVDTDRAFCQDSDMLAPLPYLERNRAIVDAAAVLVACPRSAEEETRSGTWSTVRYARKQGKPVHLVLPDGTVKVEVP
jgi:hypothetical protein